MTIEIKKVPPYWNHPRADMLFPSWEHRKFNKNARYVPLINLTWKELQIKGQKKISCQKCMPSFDKNKATHFQAYEIILKRALPISPILATKQEVIEYITKNE